MQYSEWLNFSILLAYSLTLLYPGVNKSAPILIAFIATMIISISSIFDELNHWTLHLSYLACYLCVWRFIKDKTLIILIAAMVMLQVSCTVEGGLYMYQNVVAQWLNDEFIWQTSFLYENYATINTAIHALIVANGARWRGEIRPRISKLVLFRPWNNLFKRSDCNFAFS